jgi:uncharacterized protein YeaO (DUF488 family)
LVKDIKDYKLKLYERFMIRTKSILSPIEEFDGTRISVMSRHTLNDGKTPDTRITNDSYHLWIPNLAPPPVLIGDYYKRGLSWGDFERRYFEHLQKPRVRERILDLIANGLSEDITLMCIEETPEKCHRRLLAEECKRISPDISIELK